jgi:hypothetical protein
LLYSPSKWQAISITHPHASAGFHLTRKLALLSITVWLLYQLQAYMHSPVRNHPSQTLSNNYPVKLWKKQNQKCWKQQNLRAKVVGSTSEHLTIFKALQFSKTSLSSHKLEDYGSKGTSSDWAH